MAGIGAHLNGLRYLQCGAGVGKQVQGSRHCFVNDDGQCWIVRIQSADIVKLLGVGQNAGDWDAADRYDGLKKRRKKKQKEEEEEKKRQGRLYMPWDEDYEHNNHRSGDQGEKKSSYSLTALKVEKRQMTKKKQSIAKLAMIAFFYMSHPKDQLTFQREVGLVLKKNTIDIEGFEVKEEVIAGVAVAVVAEVDVEVGDCLETEMTLQRYTIVKKTRTRKKKHKMG